MFDDIHLKMLDNLKMKSNTGFECCSAGSSPRCSIVPWLATGAAAAGWRWRFDERSELVDGGWLVMVIDGD